MGECEGCNSCNACQSCDTNCDSAQTFCRTTGQTVGSFSFAGYENSFSEKPIFSRSVWNSIITYLQKAYAKGRSSNGGTCPASLVPSTQKYLTASSFNDVVEALSGLGGASNIPGTVSRNDIVKGSYFRNLELAASSLKYKSSQCDACNSGCNTGGGGGGCDYCNRCLSACQSDAGCCYTPPPPPPPDPPKA